MKCVEVRNLLPDYSVEMLDRRTQAAVKSHLEMCADCSQELRAMDAVMELVEQYGARTPPAGLFNAVRNQIESGAVAQQRPAWWAWLYTRPARYAAMSMATAALVIGAFMPTPHQPMVRDASGVPPLPDIHTAPTGSVSTTALASSIRQHAMSAGEGSLTDRVAWEAMAQLVTQKREKHGEVD